MTVPDDSKAPELKPEDRSEIQRLRKEMEEFSYIASHDLQEPLRKIIAFSDRLKDRYEQNAPAAERDYFERMQNAAQRMKIMLDDLLTLSRVTSRDVAMEAFDPGDVLCEVVGEMERSLAECRGAVEMKPLPAVRASRLQVRQLFQALLGNAVKFAQAGVPPRIAVEGRDDGNGFVEIRVADNGIGFEERYFERILKPFQRLHARSEYLGTGIGLAVCHKIVLRHGGTLTATSVPGEGSVFIARIPKA